MEDVVEESELAQDVCVAEPMRAVQLEIGDEAVVDQPACEASEDGEVLDGVASPLAVDAVPGHQLCAQDVEPMELSGDAQARFIGMSHGDVGEEVGNPAFKAFQSPVG